MDPFEPIMGELRSTSTTTTAVASACSTEDTSLDQDTGDTTSLICQLADDNLLANDVTATVVYTASAFETDKFADISKQNFELERL